MARPGVVDETVPYGRFPLRSLAPLDEPDRSASSPPATLEPSQLSYSLPDPSPVSSSSDSPAPLSPVAASPASLSPASSAPAAAAGMKRKRGRPRKGDELMEPPAVAAAAGPVSELLPAPKRKRGRPRKGESKLDQLVPERPREAPAKRAREKPEQYVGAAVPRTRRGARATRAAAPPTQPVAAPVVTGAAASPATPPQPVWSGDAAEENDSKLLLAATHPMWSFPTREPRQTGKQQVVRASETVPRTAANGGGDDSPLNIVATPESLLYLFSEQELTNMRKLMKKGPRWVPPYSVLRNLLIKLGREVPEDLEAMASRRRPRSRRPTAGQPHTRSLPTIPEGGPASISIQPNLSYTIYSPAHFTSTLKAVVSATYNSFIPPVIECQFGIDPAYALPNCPPLSAAFDISDAEERGRAQGLFRQHLMTVIATADGYTWMDQHMRTLHGAVGREWICACSLSSELAVAGAAGAAAEKRQYNCGGFVRIEFDDCDRACTVAYRHHAIHRPPAEESAGPPASDRPSGIGGEEQRGSVHDMPGSGDPQFRPMASSAAPPPPTPKSSTTAERPQTNSARKRKHEPTMMDIYNSWSSKSPISAPAPTAQT